jgi:hypothetical protein
MSKNVKVDFSAVLLGLDGKELKEVSGVDAVRASLLAAGVSTMLLDQATAALRPFWGSGGEPEEVKLTACRACANALQSDKAPNGAEAVDRMRIAIKLMDPKQPVEVTEPEKKKILDAIEKVYGNIVYFRVNELFERAAAERDKPAEPQEARAA